MLSLPINHEFQRGGGREIPGRSSLTALFTATGLEKKDGKATAEHNGPYHGKFALRQSAEARRGQRTGGIITAVCEEGQEAVAA